MSKGYTRKDPVTGLAVVQTAKEFGKKSKEVTLSTGVKARIKTVAASLIDRVTSNLPEPEVPNEFNKDKEREEPNPLSPKYLKAVKEYQKMRGQAAMEAMIMFGIDLIDPIPDTKEWLSKLKFIESQGYLDLTKYDLEDPITLEYLYKAYIAVGSEDLKLVMESAGIPTEAIQKAEASFPGDEKRDTDSGSAPEGQVKS